MKTFMQFLRESVMTPLTPTGNPGNRKYRLFAVACCYQIWNLITDERSKMAVEVAERFADGQAELEDLNAARIASYEAAYATIRNTDSDITRSASYYAAWAAAQAKDYDASQAASGNAVQANSSVKPRQEALKHCIYIKHHFAFEDLSGNVISMARRIYDDRDWKPDAMSILADALEDAGVTDEHVLHHCKEHKEHARGCWVVDNILGLK